MARPRKNTPHSLERQQTGRDRARSWDAAGVRHNVLLPGGFNSKESLAA